MKLGCICGTFNRAFATGAMDQLRFLERCGLGHHAYCSALGP